MKTYLTYLNKLHMAVVFLLAVFLLTSCKATTQFILMPDPDGKTGGLDITDGAGTDSQILNKPWHRTKTSLITGKLGSPEVIEEKEARTLIKEALAAEPKQPVTYILYFDTGSSALTADAENQLSLVMNTIKLMSSTNIAVIGHSDSVGSEQVNNELSLKRSQTVVEALVAKGIDRNNIEVTNHGKANPLVPVPDGVAEPRNRRVEVVVR